MDISKNSRQASELNSALNPVIPNLLGLATRQFILYACISEKAFDRKPRLLLCTRMGSTFMELVRKAENFFQVVLDYDLLPISRKSAMHASLASRNPEILNLGISLFDVGSSIVPPCGKSSTQIDWVSSQRNHLNTLLGSKNPIVVFDSGLHGTTFNLIDEGRINLRYGLLLSSPNVDRPTNHLDRLIAMLGTGEKKSFHRPNSWLVLNWHLLETVLESDEESVDHWTIHGDSVCAHDKECKILKFKPSRFSEELISSSSFISGLEGNINNIRLFCFLFFPTKGDIEAFRSTERIDNISFEKKSALLVSDPLLHKNLWISGALRHRYGIFANLWNFFYVIYLFFIPNKLKSFMKKTYLKSVSRKVKQESLN